MTKAMLLAAAALAGGVWAAERFTPEQLEARFHYDLGPAVIDVSSYPEAQRGNYATFLRTCSHCHTPARAINSPYVGRADWRRFIKRMHLKSKDRYGAGFYKVEAEAVLDFLAYDAKLRKVDGKASFAEQDQERKALFALIKAERKRRSTSEDKGKTKPYPDVPGPQPNR